MLKWLRYRPEYDVKLLTCMTCMIEQSDRVEVCERPGLCTVLCYAVFMDLEDKIGDAVCIQNTALMPDTGSLTRFFLISLRGRISPSWRCTANPEDTVLMTSEVIDLMLELILHTTRETLRLRVCRLYGQLPNRSGSTS